MTKQLFSDKRISAIVSILPDRVAEYAEELEDYNFPVAQSRRLGIMMDYRKRRESSQGDGLSDYAFQGIEYLLSKGAVRKEEIGAIVVVSSSQDYILPSTSYLLQGMLGLSQDVYCSDICQVCGGYIFGLLQAFMLMDTMGFDTVLMVTGDFLTKKICSRDRNSRPIIGDAANVSVIRSCKCNGTICSSYLNYGNLASKIIIPAGGLKNPSSAETAVEKQDESGNFRAQDHFYMDGEAVFNFAMTKVPPVVQNVLSSSGNKIGDIDYYIFHQPNKYMVDRLADELDIPQDKIFDNIVGEYGNASTATIPLNICHNIASEATARKLKLCLSGFGAGLTCNAMVLDNPPMDLCEIIEYVRN